MKELFKEIKILTVASQYVFDCIMYVRNNIHLFHKNSDFHNLNTRNKHKLAIQKLRLHKVGNSFVGLSIKCFNKIPQHIIDLPLHKFKVVTKTCLMSKGYYRVDDFLNDKSPWTC